MTAELEPIADAAVDPMIGPHLERGETVLWQGRPEVPSFGNLAGMVLAAAGIAFGLLLLAGLGPVVLPALALGTGSTLVPGLAFILFGGLFLWLGWLDRDANWRFAITDRRLLVVRGAKLFRYALPGEIRRVRIRGRTVYWNRETSASGSEDRRSGRYIGFRGMRDPEAMKAAIEDWQEGFSRRAAATASAFTAAAQGADPQATGITRVLHPETGLHIDVPSEWQITVDNSYDGPLRLFGITILPRVIRPAEERPYGDGKPWTTLNVRGAPDAGLHMVVRDGPLTQTLDAVVNDPWNARLGLEILQTTPDLRVGPFEGFSLVRTMRGGAVLTGFGRVENPVATRMIWLGSGNRSVEIMGMARLDMEDVQYAIDAMVNSLGYQ